MEYGVVLENGDIGSTAADVRNQADSLCYQLERSLSEAGDKVDSATKGDIEAKIKSVREALGKDDVAAIKSTMDELTKSSHKMAEQMYKEAAAKQQTQQQAGQHR